MAEELRLNAVGKCVHANERMCLPSREFAHWAVHQKKITERIRLAVFSVYGFPFSVESRRDFVLIFYFAIMEWTNSFCLKLIGLYQEREVLWNPVHKDYKNKYKIPLLELAKEPTQFLSLAGSLSKICFS